MSGRNRSDREIELKLDVAANLLPKIDASDLVSESQIAAPSTKILSSIYYDTPGQKLSKAGIALRVRDDGSRKIQTVKTGQTKDALFSDRYEFETEVSSMTPQLNAIPKKKIRKAISQLANGHDLDPFYRTDIKRRIHHLSVNGSQIELAIDDGKIVANGRHRVVSEVELELISGDVADLFRFAQRLHADIPARISLETKAHRGEALANNQTPKAVKAKRVSLGNNDSVEEAFVAIVRQCAIHLFSNYTAVAENRNVEGVHQMRVAMRRLRAAIILFKPFRLDPAVRAIGEEAKWFAGKLGESRDLDVFLEEIVGPVESQFADDGALEVLASTIKKRSQDKWSNVVDLLNTPRYSAFTLELASLAEVRPWRDKRRNWKEDDSQKSVSGFAKKALKKRQRKIKALGERLQSLTVDERHTLRKELKKLRYALEFFYDLYPADETKTYVKTLAHLQDLFGYMNDLTTAETIIFQAIRNEDCSKRALTWAGGIVLGWHAHRFEQTWSSAQAGWNDLSNLRPVWH